ncbi:MAG: RNase adapter RapZ [Rhodospirillales bacterium]|nr:RNase adapter RapZ [Rhodospirillales bacterium]
MPPQTSAPQDSRQVILVTGMSGAGKTTVLKAFEDLGFEALDNVPLYLLGRVVEADGDSDAGGTSATRPLAIGVDIRTRDFDAESLIAAVTGLSARATLSVKVLFVDCGDEELLARYTATRHRHPLAADRPVLDGVRLERQLLAPLLSAADVHLDTTGRTPYDVKDFLAQTFSANKEAHHRDMAVFVTSFSYRHGLPRDADLVFDVRFLRNPHYDPNLRPLTGQNEAVQRFIAEDPGFNDFMERLMGLLTPLVPRYAEEGKSYLTIAVGCTGGKHRSVFVAERLAAWLNQNLTRVHLTHRDMPETSEPNTPREGNGTTS